MTLQPNQQIPPLFDVLAGSEYESELECIERVFNRLMIDTVNDLDNSPRILTCSFCMVNTHELIQYIRDYMEGGEPEMVEMEYEPELTDEELVGAETLSALGETEEEE